jgi:hypothetical protein
VSNYPPGFDHADAEGPQSGEDTGSYQDLQEIRSKLHKWLSIYQDELEPDETRSVDEAIQSLTNLSDALKAWRP